MSGAPTFTAVRSPGAPARLPLATRIADYTVMALAVLLGGGALALFAWPGRPVLVRTALSPYAALVWNALLSLAFFVQHSVMVRRSIRARLSPAIPTRYDAAFYAITSGLVLAPVLLLYVPAGPPLFRLHGLPRLLVGAAAVLALAVLIWGVCVLRTFDPFGLRPIRQHLRGEPGQGSGTMSSSSNALVVRGPYRWVRHPLYSAIIVLLWADAEMDPARLELAILWTAWIVVGTRLEERDLVAEFGHAYRAYRRAVPMLVPWKRAWKSGARADARECD
jgi:methanethiol S-methyltransferase